MDNILETSTTLQSTPPTNIQHLDEIHISHPDIQEVETPPQLIVEQIVEAGKPPKTSS